VIVNGRCAPRRAAPAAPVKAGLSLLPARRHGDGEGLRAARRRDARAAGRG